jgi:hypothetical protein
MTVYTGATESINFDLGQPDAEDLRELADLRRQNAQGTVEGIREIMAAMRIKYAYPLGAPILAG